MSVEIQQFDSRLPWLKGRQRFIGSSDAAAILGCGYADQSVTSIWQSKIQEIRDEPKRSAATVQLMADGVLNEPLVIQAFADRNPTWKVDPGTRFDFRVSADHPFLASSLDSWVETEVDQFPLEAKWILNPSRKIDGDWVNEWVGPDGEERLPMMYQVQNMHQIICTGAQRGCVAAFVRGVYVERWVERDDEVIAWMIGEYRKFWQHVIDRIPPPEPKQIQLAQMRSEEAKKGTAKLVGGELSAKVRKVLEAQREMAKIQKRVDVISKSVMKSAGTAEYFVLDDNQTVKINTSSLREMAKLPAGVIVE